MTNEQYAILLNLQALPSWWERIIVNRLLPLGGGDEGGAASH